MEYLLTILLAGLIAFGMYIFIDKKFKELQESGKENESQKLMLDVIEKLRTDLRGGLDKNTEQVQKRLDETLKQLQGQFTDVRKTVDSRMKENTKTLNDRLDSAAKVIYGVKEELGRVREIGGQIKKLQEVLGGQKLRGNLGEQIMNDLISQIIPFANYEFQYTFKGGATVDAVIKTQNGLIPIDSKFPLENYRQILAADNDKERDVAQKEFIRDVKKHINDIHKKYIRQEEGTIDFALMYVPADSVYFEIIVNSPELSSYAQDKRVLVVSPSSFYHFLQIILISYQSQKFEEHAKQVLSLIRGVKQESEKFGDNLAVLSKHINNAKGKMDDVQSGYSLLDGKISQVNSYNTLSEGEKSSDDDSAPELVAVGADDEQASIFEEGEKKVSS